MLREIRIRFQEAFARWLPFLTVHLFIRLVIAAILVPLIGALLALSLSFGDQAAMTDQDIARFLLTPAGLLAGIAVVSLLVIAAVLDVAVMTTLLHQGHSRPVHALQTATRFILRSIGPLVRFALAFLARVALLAAPFLAMAGAIALLLLREYDINYYLTARPPSFLIAVVLIGGLLTVLAALLLHRFSGWAIAMHLTLFERSSARASFLASRDRMEGHRKNLVMRVLTWLAVRGLIAAAIAAVAGFALAELPDLAGNRLRLLTGSMIAVGVLWSLANTVLNAIANGVLADILNDEFERAQIGRTSYEDHHGQADPVPLFSVPNLVVGGLAILSIASLGTGGVLLENVRSDAQVEVIGHRGAAALRPENTLAAVEKAIEDGADWVEIDVQESADGEVIIAHDSDFMKAARVPTKVWDVTAAELADIDIGSWFDPAYADERVPTLEQVLATAKDRAKVIIELKYYGHDVDLENRVIAEVEAAGMADQIATMSLKYPAVQKMLSLRPDWRTGVLAATAVGDLSGLDGNFLAVNTGQATTRLVQRADAAGKDVYVWTVNDPVSMMRMITLGVDGLITDDPALARRVIAHRASLNTIERLLLAVGDRIGVAFDLDAPEELRP